LQAPGRPSAGHSHELTQPDILPVSSPRRGIQVFRLAVEHRQAGNDLVTGSNVCRLEAHGGVEPRGHGVVRVIGQTKLPAVTAAGSEPPTRARLSVLLGQRSDVRDGTPVLVIYFMQDNTSPRSVRNPKGDHGDQATNQTADP